MLSDSTGEGLDGLEAGSEQIGHNHPEGRILLSTTVFLKVILEVGYGATFAMNYFLDANPVYFISDISLHK